MNVSNGIPFSKRLKYGYFQYFDHFLGRERFFGMTRKSRSNFYNDLQKRLEQRGEGVLTPVDRVKHLSKKDFFNKYVRKGLPVVIEGAAKEWGCVKKWSLDYFNDLHGDDQIIHMDQKDVGANVYEETTLGSVIDDIKAGKDSYYRFYPLLQKHPEHILDFDYKWLQEKRPKASFGESFHVFISSKGGFTPVHNASSHNLFTQVYGEKEWILYPFDAACIIDPSPARNVYRGAPIKNDKIFDPFDPNYDDFPLYKYINGYKVHLKPGDVFYNPPYMWHSVKNPTESIGVGYRYFSPAQTYFKYPLYMFLEMFAFHPPIWKTWSNYADVNLIHLAETGALDEIAKKRGVKKITNTVR